MRRAIRHLAAMFAVLAPSAAGAGQAGHELAKVPTFRPGDRFAVTLTGRSSSAVLGKDGKLVQDEKRSRTEDLVQEVLAVSDDGRATALRTTVRSAKETTSSAQPAKSAFSKAVTLAGIFARVDLTGGRYVTDTRSVASTSAAKLSASQIALLKKVLVEGMTFRAYDPVEAALLPAGRVDVGHTWSPPRADLRRWAAHDPIVQRLHAAVNAAQFKLVSVEAGLARVRGVVRLRARLAGKAIQPVLKRSVAIDLASGRRVSRTVSVAFAARLGGGQVVFEGRQMSVAAFTPGSGRASAAPRKAQELGWPRPGKDTNRFRDAQRGLSLNVPPAYRPRMPAGGDMVALFACGEGAHLAVSLRRMPRPVDMDEVLTEALKNLRKTVAGFELRRKTPLQLAGNVPAVLLVGAARGAAVIRLVAIDDRRIVSVIAAAPPGRAALAQELIRTAKTLRVFPPEPEPPESAPKRP